MDIGEATIHVELDTKGIKPKSLEDAFKGVEKAAAKVSSSLSSGASEAVAYYNAIKNGAKGAAKAIVSVEEKQIDLEKRKNAVLAHRKQLEDKRAKQLDIMAEAEARASEKVKNSPTGGREAYSKTTAENWGNVAQRYRNALNGGSERAGVVAEIKGEREELARELADADKELSEIVEQRNKELSSISVGIASSSKAAIAAADTQKRYESIADDKTSRAMYLRKRADTINRRTETVKAREGVDLSSAEANAIVSRNNAIAESYIKRADALTEEASRARSIASKYKATSENKFAEYHSLTARRDELDTMQNDAENRRNSAFFALSLFDKQDTNQHISSKLSDALSQYESFSEEAKSASAAARDEFQRALSEDSSYSDALSFTNELQKGIDTDISTIEKLEQTMDDLKAKMTLLQRVYDELYKDDDGKKAEPSLEDKAKSANVLLSVLKPIERLNGTIGGSVVKGLKAADTQANKFGMAIANSVKEAVMKRFKKLNRSVDGSGKSFKHALKNILRYGLGIRSLFVLFNRLRNMIKSGIGSIVQYSSSADKSISNLVNAFKQFKTSVSVAFLPIIQTVEPAITRLINLLARAMNAVAAFFATLSGSTVFLRAKERVDSYAKSLKGAGAAQKYFSGLDEVRTFENGGGGGGGVDSPFKMFEWSDVGAGISDFAEKVKQAWKDVDFTGIGKIVGDKIAGAIGNIDLTNIKNTLHKTAISVATFFNGLAETDVFSAAGTKISDALDMISKTVRDFATKADWGSWAKSIASGINSAIAGINEKDIAFAFSRIFNGVNTYITEFWGSIDFSGLGEKIKNGISIAIANTDFRTAGESVLAKFNGVIDMVASAVNGFDFSRVGTAIADFFNGMFESVDRAKLLEAAKNIVNGIGDAIGSALSNISIGSVISSVGEFAATIIETIAKKLEDNEEVIVNAVADILSGLSKAVKKCTAALLKLGKEILTVIWRGITENLSGAFNIGKGIVDGIAEGIGTNSSVVTVALGAIATGFVALKTAIAGMELVKTGTSIVKFATEMSAAGGSIANAAAGVSAFGGAIGSVGVALTHAVPYVALAVGAIGLLTVAVEAENAKEAEWQAHLDSVRQEAATLPDAIQGVVDSLNNESEAYLLAQEASQGKIKSIAQESSHYTELLSQLDSCVDADGKILSGKETLANFIITKLKESYGIEIDVIDGVIQKYGEQKQTIQDLITQKKLAAMVSILEDDYGEALVNYDNVKSSLEEINNEIIGKQAERDSAYASMTGAAQNLADAQAELNAELMKESPNDYVLDTLAEKVRDAESAFEEAKATYHGTFEAVEELYDAYKNGQSQLEGYSNTLQTYTLAQQLSAKGLTEAAAYVAEHGAASFSDYAEGVMQGLTNAAKAADQHVKDLEASGTATTAEINAAKDDAANAWKEVETQYDNFFGAGKFVSEGLAEGLRDGEVDIIDATRAAAEDSLKEIKEAYGIASPSKVMAEIGMFLDQGLAQGITENEDDIKNALVSATEKALTSMKEVIDGADMDIGKTLKDTNGELSERSGVLTNLTDAYTRAASSMKSANNELSKLTTPVLDAADAIELAGNNFGKTDTAVTEASNNISKAVTQKFKETSEIVYETFDGMTTKVGDFAFDAQEQWDRGMRSADFSKELVKAINAAISAAETALKGAYTKFYNCGAYIGKGLYDGLVSYKTSLIKAMQDVINGIKDTVTVTMKIASPSKVMYQLGEYISEGLANGIGDEGRKVLSTAGKLSNDTLAQFKDIERLDALQALQNIQVPTPALSYGNIIPPKTVVSIESLDTIEDKLTAILNKMEQIKASDNGSAANEYTFNATINRKVLFSEIIEEAKLSQIKNGKNPFALGW